MTVLRTNGTIFTRPKRGIVLRLKPKKNGWGSTYWSFFAGIEQGYWQVNRAVCAAFNGIPPSNKHEAAHLDGNTDDNSSANLTWATPVENAAHKILHGTAPVGSKNGSSKLSEPDVAEIIAMIADGRKVKIIAKKFGIMTAVINRIAAGTAWAHVRRNATEETRR